MRAGE
jgi:hypothetical protein